MQMTTELLFSSTACFMPHCHHSQNTRLETIVATKSLRLIMDYLVHDYIQLTEMMHIEAISELHSLMAS